MATEVTQMWDKLTPADVELAKHGLNLRRADMLTRHAQEIKSMDSEQAGLETLNRLIDAFTQKLNTKKNGYSPSSELVKPDV